VDNESASGVDSVEGLEFKFRSGQVLHIVANDRHRFKIYGSGCITYCGYETEMGLSNSLHASD